MKKVLVLLAMVLGVIPTMWADISVQTKIFDTNSQPMLVGGFIENYSVENVSKKGVIISMRTDNMTISEKSKFVQSDVRLHYSGYKADVPFDNSRFDLLLIDCSNTNKEEYAVALQYLLGNADYYVKAFVINKEDEVIYGDTKKVHTKDFDRYVGYPDYANVWYAFKNTLFDLVTDEIINPNDGFYYSTNENPTRVRHQVGTSYNTCYKFQTEWNYKLWYYHSSHCNQDKIINTPIMSFSNKKLFIEKNPLDADKDITIFYSINGNYFRPESYTDIYSQPLSITEPCAVYCYAISSDGYISYTNTYVIDDYNIGNKSDNNSEFGTVADVVDLGLSVKWSSWNLGASSVGDYGGLYGAGDPTGLKTSTSYRDYYWKNGESICGTDYDLAKAKWGEEWRMPKWSELEELITKCQWKDGEVNGVKGNWVTGPNGNSIFLPWAGNRKGASIFSDEGIKGYYWSGDMGVSLHSYGYKDIDVKSGGVFQTDGAECFWGQSIRPVYVEETDTEDVPEYVDVCGVKWARGNLQYDAVNGGGELFQENWKIASSQWHFFRYDEGITSYQTSKTDKQIDHFTWGVCGEWDYLNDVKIYSTAKNTDINAKMFTDADCKTITTDYESAKYGDIAYWASNGQYRLPTAEEIDLLINTASYQFGYYLTTEGVKINGCLFTTPTDGRITDSNYKSLTDNDLKKGLFIPIAGGSHTNRTVIEGLFNGESSYWTSTVESYPQTIHLTYNYPHRGKYNSYSGQWASDLRSIRPVYIQRITPDDNGDVDYSNDDINEKTDLNGNVIGNIFYNISDENGEYSSAEGCIILKKSISNSDMSNLDGQDIFGEDFKNSFTGIVFNVQAGSGTIKVNAESVGNMTLKVKIGSNMPMTFELERKMKASIPYSVSEPTYVYIYGGETSTANARGLRAAYYDNALKIYGIEWSGEVTSIESINRDVETKAVIYNMNGQRVETPNKGFYIKNGKKVIIK